MNMWNRSTPDESTTSSDGTNPTPTTSLLDVDRVFLPDADAEPISTAQALAVSSTSTMPERPAAPVAPASPADVHGENPGTSEARTALPARTPGAAPAIAASNIMGPAVVRQQAPAANALDEHPLYSPDLAYRYSKEQATGFNRGLRNAYAAGALSDLSDTELGLVTVPATSVYATVAADLGCDPLA